MFEALLFLGIVAVATGIAVVYSQWDDWKETK